MNRKLRISASLTACLLLGMTVASPATATIIQLHAIMDYAKANAGEGTCAGENRQCRHAGKAGSVVALEHGENGQVDHKNRRGREGRFIGAYLTQALPINVRG